MPHCVDRFYIALFSALQQSQCVCMLFRMSEYLFIARFFFFFFKYPPKWCTYSTDIAGATFFSVGYLKPQAETTSAHCIGRLCVPVDVVDGTR